MDNLEILSHVDHTLLAAYAPWNEIEKLCGEAVLYKTASVCIPPSYVRRVREAYGERLKICTVIGFPLGYSVTAAKLAEAGAALRDGADELDMVINLGDAKNGDFQRITAEICELKKAVESKILKVIVEACYLTEDDKITLCRAVTQGGADYIKTSTGFGAGGATLDDALLFKRHIGPGVKIKAAGGIRTRAEMIAFLEAGCDRLGMSSAIKILHGGEAGGY